MCEGGEVLGVRGAGGEDPGGGGRTPGLEIVPGRGVALAVIGDHRTRVEERVGRPGLGPAAVRPAVYDTTPALVITYAPTTPWHSSRSATADRAASPRRVTTGSG
ncbi:hypothetical protein GCM10010433_55800 [Streptomyces pulveraceus]